MQPLNTGESGGVRAGVEKPRKSKDGKERKGRRKTHQGEGGGEGAEGGGKREGKRGGMEKMGKRRVRREMEGTL